MDKELIMKLISILEDSKYNTEDLIEMSNLRKLQMYDRYKTELSLYENQIKDIDEMIEKLNDILNRNEKRTLWIHKDDLEMIIDNIDFYRKIKSENPDISDFCGFRLIDGKNYDVKLLPLKFRIENNNKYISGNVKYIY